MNVILFDRHRANYYPLSYTRPISYIRVGISTIKEKWERYYKAVSVSTDDYLNTKYPILLNDDNLWINSKTIPTKELVIELNNLRKGESLESDGDLIAFRNSTLEDINKLNTIDSNVRINTIDNLCDVFLKNFDEIISDFHYLSNNRESCFLNKTNTLIGNQIFIEKGAEVSCAVLNSEEGPIYIGKNVKIMSSAL